MISPILVSVVTVCYDSEITLARTIESVMNQTYPNIEYIIIDGKSNDTTLEIVKCYASKYEKIGKVLKWISEPDKGISDAFNKGINLATGELIGIVNSDDWLEPDGVETIVDNLDSTHAIYCGTLNFFDRRTRTVKLRRSRPFLLPLGMYVMHPTVFVKREAYRTYAFDTNLSIAMDYDILLKFRKRGFRIKTINKVISNMQDGGVSSNVQKMRAEEKLVMRRNLSYWQYLLAAVKLRMENLIIKRHI